MKCAEASSWLLSAKSSAALPGSLRRHLQQCARCRDLHRRLLGLETAMQDAFPVQDNPTARTDLLQKLPARGVPRVTSRLLRVAGMAAGLLLALGLSWLLLVPKEDPLEKAGGKSSWPKAGSAEEVLVARFLERDLRLAETTLPKEQFQVLADMAADLRSEALRLAGQTAPEDLPLVAELYQRVVRKGLVGRAALLPVEEQQALLPPVIKDLRETEDAVQQAVKKGPSTVSDFLRAMAAAAQESSQNLLRLGKSNPPPLPETWDPLPASTSRVRTLLAALVEQGLRLAEDDDPLRRVDYCSDVADHLLQAIVVASAQGDTEGVTTLGSHLGEIMDRGVNKNLAQVPADDPRTSDLEKALQRAEKAIDMLRTALDKAKSSGSPEKSSIQHERVKALEKSWREVEKDLRKASQKAKKDGEKGKKDDHKDKKGKKGPKDKGDWSANPNSGPALSRSANAAISKGDLPWRRDERAV